MKVLKNCVTGLYLLCQDPAGTIALLVLTVVTILCLKGKVSDISFAAVCSMLPVVIGVLKHKSFSGSDIDSLPFPPKGQL